MKNDLTIQAHTLSTTIEAFGNADMKRQQLAVYRCSRALGEGRFISNQGWTLVAAVEDLSRLPTLLKLLNICGTVFLTCETSSGPAIRDYFASDEIRYFDDYIIWAGDRRLFHKAMEVLEETRDVRKTFSCVVIDKATPGNVVGAIQQAQIDARMPAMPGYYLRGSTGRSLTVCMFDSEGNVASGITGILNDNSFYGQSIQITNRFVGARWRGHRLSRIITAACIVSCAERFGVFSFFANNQAANNRANQTTFFDHKLANIKRVGLFKKGNTSASGSFPNGSLGRPS